MRTSYFIGAVVAATALAGSGGVAAAVAKKKKAGAVEPVAVECPKETALGHYKEGEAAYKAGDPARAIKSYAAAYACRPAPEFLFNVAQGYRKLGDCGRAMKYFEEYLRLKPGAPNRAAVEAGITECLGLVKEGKSRPYDLPEADDILAGRTAAPAPGTTAADGGASGSKSIGPVPTGPTDPGGAGATGPAGAAGATDPALAKGSGVLAPPEDTHSTEAPTGLPAAAVTVEPEPAKGGKPGVLVWAAVGGGAAVVVAGAVVTAILVLFHDTYEPDASIPVD